MIRFVMHEGGSVLSKERSVNPLLGLWGAYLFQAHLRRGAYLI